MSTRNYNDFEQYCISNMKRYGLMAYREAYSRILSKEDNNHTGHFMQLFFAVYDFYDNNPAFKDEATAPPFEIQDSCVFGDWKDFLKNIPSTYTVNRNGYNNTLRDKLPLSVGGTKRDGGRWSPTAKIMLSVVAAYMK